MQGLEAAWRRRAFGGIAAGALVPVALLVAVVGAGLGGGGFAGLGALGQAFSGPRVPAAGATASAPARERRPARLLPTAVRRRAGRPDVATSGVSVSGAGSPSGPARELDRGPGARRPRPSAPSAAAPAEPATGVASAPPPPSTPPRAPSPLDPVREAVSPVPVAGPAASEAIDAVEDAVAGLPIP